MEYTREQLDAIWARGIPVDGYDPNIIRHDACGAWILRSSYNEEGSEYGWEVDHICPKALLSKRGIEDALIDNEENLRPLHWKNNRSKSADYPDYTVVTVADGEKNVDCKKVFTVNSDVQSRLSALFGLER